MYSAETQNVLKIHKFVKLMHNEQIIQKAKWQFRNNIAVN